MTNELLTPEQIGGIKRQQRAWNSEFQVRGDAPNLGLQDFCAMHANVTRLLRDREAIAAEVLELLDGARSVYREGSNSDTKWETRKATLIKRLRGGK